MSKSVVRNMALSLGAITCIVTSAFAVQSQPRELRQIHQTPQGYYQPAPNFYRYRPIQVRPVPRSQFASNPYQQRPLRSPQHRYAPPQVKFNPYTYRQPGVQSAYANRQMQLPPLQHRPLYGSGYPQYRPYPGPGYAWQPGFFPGHARYNRSPYMPFRGYAYQPSPVRAPYIGQPVFYGANSRAAYLMPGYGYPVQPFGSGVPYAGNIPAPVMNPYRYSPGQGVIARSLLPQQAMRAPVGRYIPPFQQMARPSQRGHDAGGLYRFRPDPRFVQKPVGSTSLQQHQWMAPAVGGQPTFRPVQSLGANQTGLDHSKLVWRPMEKLAKH